MSTVTDESTTATSANPLLESTSLPKFDSISASQLTPAMKSILSKLEADFAAMESEMSTKASSDSVTFDEVLPVLEQMQHPLGYAWGIAGHLKGVKDGDDLRKAYEENQPDVVKASMKFGQSKPLYDALLAVQKGWEGRVGLPIGSPEQVRFNEIKLRFATLSTAFSNNVLDATKAFGLQVTDAKDVEGVPESALGMWAAAHKQHLIKEAGDDEDAKKKAEEFEVDAKAGPWRITLDGPSYIAAMQHIPNREVRKEVYIGYLTQEEDGEKKEGDVGKNNVVIIEEILKLRKEMAGLLGFKNYAEMSLASKMAPDVESVANLSNLILEKALPAAQKELAEATELARSEGGEEYSVENLEKLQPWDTSFWVERLKEKTFDLKEEETRPYLALGPVLNGMFGLVERIFNIEVREANGSVEVWHPDVQFFTIHDKNEDGRHIASFYLDPYSRPADKRGGAWMADCMGKSSALGIDIPVAYLTCNGSPPVGDKPSLMTFREVETLFHEFGHGLQHMLTRATVGDVAGINGVEWDAVELPSQFMENWCYDKPTVYGFAKHYETGEPLPEEMFEKLKQQKTFGAGMMACRQLLFGMMDIELHSNYDAESGESIFDVQRRMADIYTPYAKPVAEDRFLCGFGHIFAGGYSAGYYSYKWAEVMSADAFGAFEEVGLDNEEAVKEVGKKFRDTVLSLGGGVAPSEVFKKFRGRDPSPEALLRHNGLA
ncbi:oligopeptidase [Thalassiosira pseudonana CCMP1335]|uniref:oligopeptidase A n=1 Tax=Thalassiosira pseudonana TaxID=35128 RepID=B8CE50_THAPS|nr:oligopeptidase [Thalassiosira pseudonana CCMP1335]EED88210.1 oligopeptidase [Thalassiosira pseudonana CCMP1335]